MSRIRRIFQRANMLPLVGAVALSLTIVSPALADNTVTTSVVGGLRTAKTTDYTMPAATYSHIDQTQAGTLVLTADDSSGTNLGWNVTVQASNFVYSGTNNGINIPAANLSLTSASDATKVTGQGVSTSNGPKVPTASPLGTLDVQRKVLQANAGFGRGNYTQALGVSLTIPATSAVGTYTSTLTVSINVGP